MGTGPSDERYELANQLFADALEQPPAERAAFVAGRCGGDSPLEDSVMRLLSRYGKLGDFLESPPQILAPAGGGLRTGELVGRFRILGSLGHGGMGEVYRAEDTELKEVVALKTLRPLLRGEESVSERFREEIRLARKISHPNICRIFDLFVDRRGGEPLLYFTMEYLDGPTLAQRLSGGALPIAQALALIRQIAAGLDAAHHAGILHRDLKPSNILLVAEKEGGERAVITDFGLAKALDASASSPDQSITGQMAGTPDYMAPEQFLGSETSPATDVFALGCVVYEMLTGARPFPAGNVVRAAMRRVMGQPEPLSRHGTAAPHGWDAVMARALSPEPVNRYRSAGGFYEALAESQGRRSGGAPRPTRRVAIWGGGLAAMAGLGAFLRFHQWNSTVPARPVIMLTPIQYAPGSGDDPTAARAMDAMLARQLQQSGALTILDADRLQAAWARIRGKQEPIPARLDAAATRHLALRAGGNRLVSGNLFRAGDEWVLRLQLDSLGSDPAQVMDSRSQEFRGRQEDDFSAAVYRGARWLRAAMWDQSVDSARSDRVPADLTTSSWHALREFVLGNDAWRARDTDAALSHLRAALAADPGFALAASRLGDILAALGRRDEALGYQSKAADLIRQKDLTDRESLSIAGMFALDTGQYVEAERIYTRYAIEYPREALPLFYKADALESQGRAAEALEYSRKAASLDPKSSPAVFHYSYRLMAAGRFAEAETQRQAAAQLHPGGAADHLAAALAFGRFDMAACLRGLRQMGQSPETLDQSQSLALQACLMAEGAHWDEAARLLREGADLDVRSGAGTHQQFTKKCQMAQLALRRGRRQETIRHCREALDMKLDFADTMHIGCVLAQAGDSRTAAQCRVEGLPDWPCYRHWVYRLNAELAMASGDAHQALRLLQAAPPSHFYNEWPESLVRAAIAAGDRKTAAGPVERLVEAPARYFFQADVTGPGFIAWAAALAPKVPLPEAAVRKAAALSAALSKMV